MHSFFIALQFLTRLNIVRQTVWTTEDFGRSVRWFPAVGFVIGVILVGFYYLLSQVLPLGVTAALIVIFEFLLTGGIHADGLMDTSDGLFSGRDRERKLEIMKDSRVGANGVVAFVFVVLMKWQLLTVIPASMMPFLLFAMPALSRYGLTLSIACFPYAKPDGIGKAFTLYTSNGMLFFSTLFALLPCLYWGGQYATAAGLSVFINFVLNGYCTKHLGGVTGDTFGFVTELTEVFLLLAFAMIIGAERMLF